MPAFILAIFLSAFLLFQVQPIIARFILPWYGGTPAVWTTCMLFFQVGLLAGYTYAHVLVTAFRKQPKIQAAIHLAILLIACALLPIVPPEHMRPDGTEASPALGIVKLLFFTVGLPYLAIAASGPLLQHWFSETFPGKSPYRLYAVSNFGSLLGLLSYPFVFEPIFRLTSQTWIWSGTFAVYTVLAILCAIVLLKKGRNKKTTEDVEEAVPDSPTLFHRILWITFAACGSVLLIALTSQMCQDVAVVPFLWVLPLALYLITFIISFDHARWYYRPVWIPLAVIFVGAMVYLMNQQFDDTEMHIGYQILIYSMTVLTTCMICHGEMVRLKPHPHFLTSFYLSVSLGGALGGLFVSQVAPRLFNGYWEVHFILVFLALLVAFQLFRAYRSLEWKIGISVASLCAVSLLSVFLYKHYEELRDGSIDVRRGFYGVIRIYENYVGTEDAYRALFHGRISHGRQYLDEKYVDLATTYYGKDSGVGTLFRFHPNRIDPEERLPMKVGMIGLGVGTIAAHMREGDTLRLYEINPQVEDLARKHFSYLSRCDGEVSVTLGDGRVSLEQELAKEGSHKFDALFVDAFSGDSIPIHLLTKEAFEIYFQHLKDKGVLIVHITNLHLDLSDPVRRLADEFGCEALQIIHDPEETVYHEYYSNWVLITKDKSFVKAIKKKMLHTEWDTREPRDSLWTDDFSNLLEVIE